MSGAPDRAQGLRAAGPTAGGTHALRDGSLVAFTLLTQAAVGTCWSLLAVRAWSPAGDAGPVATSLLVAPLLLALGGLGVSFVHLARPAAAWRALGNLRSSWLGREVFFASAFTGALAASVLVSLAPSTDFWSGFAQGLAATLGLALLWSMAMVYRLRTVPAWDVRTTHVGFFASALGLGALTAATLLAASGTLDPTRRLVVPGLLFHLLGAASTLVWLRRLPLAGRSGLGSLQRIAVMRRRLPRARFTLSALAVLTGLAALAFPGTTWALAAALVLAAAAEAAARTLFYEARVRVGL